MSSWAECELISTIFSSKRLQGLLTRLCWFGGTGTSRRHRDEGLWRRDGLFRLTTHLQDNNVYTFENVIMFIISVMRNLFFGRNTTKTRLAENDSSVTEERQQQKKSSHQSRSPHRCVCGCVRASARAPLLSLGIRVCACARRELGGHWIWRGDISCGAEIETNGECCHQDAQIQTRTLSRWGRIKGGRIKTRLDKT